MQTPITQEQLITIGLAKPHADQLIAEINVQIKNCETPENAWQSITKQILSRTHYSFAVHPLIFESLFPEWQKKPDTSPAWFPNEEGIACANITQFIAQISLSSKNVKDFHHYTVKHYQDFWQKVIAQLNIIFTKKPEEICDLSQGVQTPKWFPHAKMNIVESCFNADPSATAIIYEDSHKNIKTMSFKDLDHLSNRISTSLIAAGFHSGDAIGIAMPMNRYAVAIYLGIIKMGGVVVSIADSFSSQEIAARLTIAKAKAIFTQDFIRWAGKMLPLYEKMKTIDTKAIVLNYEEQIGLDSESLSSSRGDILRDQDQWWNDFLGNITQFTPTSCDPMSACNILFSSGTTGHPKAIIWNHTTGIKAASDAYFHQDIKMGDVLAWPTNLGWMMGPWLIYAAFINRAAIALYTEAPKDKDFGEFIAHAKVTMLGVVPTLVATWRQTQCMEGLNFNAIKVFSTTGECSNQEDMLYLMSLANYKPLIEYCGGTEIGGAYLSSTVVQNNYPSLFSTPVMGLDIVILDAQGQPSDLGEVAIIPPSIGLSTTLVNDDHERIYFADMPKSSHGEVLRRHGDEVKRYNNGYYSVLGRVDDTMNLGGIKISAVEIERAIIGIPLIIEAAAIAIPQMDHGPNQLIIFAATFAHLEKEPIKKEMQQRINNKLNPLFKIHDIIFVEELPKTASNKIMRRILRKTYLEQQFSK
jgi:acetyl-CoA synthetase